MFKRIPSIVELAIRPAHRVYRVARVYVVHKDKPIVRVYA